MDTNTATADGGVILSTAEVHLILEYIDSDFKLLIHREGSTDKQRAKRLSIETIMRSGLEDYFKRVLLSDRFKGKLCNEAARRGYVSTLKWAREHGCSWNDVTCRYAAKGGHLDCLIWARDHGCDWDRDTCKAAARGGYLDCLKWAREHGCPWDEYTCSNAAKEGHLDCLIWAREHGCPWNLMQCKQEAENNYRRHILAWIASIGR